MEAAAIERERKGRFPMCSPVQRNYTQVPPSRTFTSPSFDPDDLRAKAAAIAALLQLVNIDARDLCSGSCGGGKKCSPVTLLTDLTGPGYLELVQESNGRKHYVLTTSHVGSMLLYSNDCKCL